MKLRNKKTGKIIEVNNIYTFAKGKRENYNSLKEFNAEWEDYKEPKEYWCIDCFSPDGLISEFTGSSSDILENRKSIGNYFDTREEAEKAVEKLKAWERLKNKGISFEAKVIDRKWYLEPKAEPQRRTFDEAHDLYKDIMFVFGVEE